MSSPRGSGQIRQLLVGIASCLCSTGSSGFAEEKQAVVKKQLPRLAQLLMDKAIDRKTVDANKVRGVFLYFILCCRKAALLLPLLLLPLYGMQRSVAVKFS